MNSLTDALRRFMDSATFKGFKKNDYLLADTRIPYVTLYDHSILTSGIAVAITKELLIRGKNTKELSGKEMKENDLIALVRWASLLHDLGKAKSKKIVGGFYDHVGHSLEISQEILSKYDIKEPYFSMILDIISRHHIRDKPESLLQKIVCLADSLASAGDRPDLAKAETRKELLDISRSNCELYNEIFDGEKGLSVVFGDVDKVHSYVFESLKLPEIRGGSEILNDLNYELLEELFEGVLARECLIHKGGGTFSAVVPASLAKDLINKIEKKYLDKTKTATITCAYEEADYLQFARGLIPYANEDIKTLGGKGIGNWLIESHFGKDRNKWFEMKEINGKNYEICKKKGFGEIVAGLQSELRRKKDMKDEIPFYEALPIGRRCNSCGKRMVISVDDTTGDFICEVCLTKREKGRGEKLRFRENFNKYLDNKNIKIENFYSKFPKYLTELTEKYGGYFAFIYADGNEIGALLDEIKAPAGYRHFAEELMNATLQSVFDAILGTFGEKIKELNPIPFEIINIGGDDVSIIISAPFSLKFSKLLLENFEKNTEKMAKEFEREKLTMSLGMSICKAKYPVYFAEKIAESLLKDAKRKAKENREELKSTLSYIYLTAHIASESGKELLEMNYILNKKLSLTMRPYTLEDFEFMLNKAGEIRTKDLLPTTQRRALMQALGKGRWQSVNFILYQIARMKEESKKELIGISQELSTRFGYDKHDLWKLKTDSDGVKFFTPLFDLLEIVEINEIGGGIVE